MLTIHLKAFIASIIGVLILCVFLVGLLYHLKFRAAHHPEQNQEEHQPHLSSELMLIPLTRTTRRRGVPRPQLNLHTSRPDSNWSILTNIGHDASLEPSAPEEYGTTNQAKDTCDIGAAV